MLKTLRRIKIGAGYLDGYGEHPGTVVMIALIAACTLAGTGNVNMGPLPGAILGFCVSLAIFLPMWIVGCIDRAKDYERDQEALERDENVDD